MKKINKGFTLIELLIVIALLGALAVALLASLDPLEQIKKGTDTGMRNTVAEIGSSFTRYASIKAGVLPYASTIAWSTVGTVAGGVAYDAIASVVGVGELKSDFMSLADTQLGEIYVTADQERAYVCFWPKAKSFRSDTNSKFATSAVAGTMVEKGDCNASGTSAGTADLKCYWCIR